MDINRNTFLEKEKTEMSDWYWSPEETKKFYKSLNTLVNGGSVILKNLKAKILENEGVDENEGKFCLVMTNRLVNNMMVKTGRYLERLEEIKDGDFEKIVNSYREKTKSDNDYVMKKSTNKLIRKYDIKNIEEMLCGGKCPEEEDVSCTTSNFNKNFKFRSGVKYLLTAEDEKKIKMFACY